MFDTQVSGGDSICKMLDKLGSEAHREFKKAAKKETRQCLKPVQAAAKAATPVKTRRTQKAIKIRAWRRPERGEIGFKVVIDPGKSRDDLKGSWYGAMVESGYIANGVYVPGRHMVENAYKQHGKAAGQNTAKAISNVADKIIRS